MISTVNVTLAERSYDIHIDDNLLEDAGARLKAKLPRPYTAIVTDENVQAALGERLSNGLRAAGIDANWIVLSPGEQTKSFAQLEKLCAELLAAGIERGDHIVAFGGGVIGDLTGFAASILRRGCQFVQIPTTLLAQVDSSVGGKTAINTAHGKNLVGAFHQPSAVLIDLGSLETLPARELRAGYAEVVKYGLLGDAGFFAWLEANGAHVISGKNEARRYAITQSCAAKAAIVAKDEREKGDRALLNLGHTFGHAIESVFGYGDAVRHGEAVAAGMALAFDYAASQNLCPHADAARVKAHLRATGLPASLSDLPDHEKLTTDPLISAMLQDKKVEAGALTLILTKGIGKAFVAKNAPLEPLRAFLQSATRTN